MTWNIVSDSSCDLRMAGWDSPSVRFETVPLRIQVGTREFLDDDNLMVPDLLDAMAAEKSAASSPPAPPRISMMTFFSSRGSLGSSRILRLFSSFATS